MVSVIAMRTSRIRGVAAVLAVVTALGAALLPTTTAAAAPAAPGCDFADPGTGTYADTLCWLDLTSLDQAVAGTPEGQGIDLQLPGGYRLAATVTVTGGAVAPTRLPTYVGSWLGNRGHYTGIDAAVRPALYQQASATTTTATLADVRVTDAAGTPVTGWSLVGADAEETAARESITWTSDAPFTSLTVRPDGTDERGTACGGGFTGIGTTTVTCTGNGSTPTGTAIVATREPTTFSQTMASRGGREGVAFGVLVSRVSLTKQVVGGFDGDAFRAAVVDAAGRPVAAADTTGASSASTGEVTLLVPADGTPLTFSETPLGTTDAARYGNPSWSCTRNGVAAADLPDGTGVGTSASVAVGVGDAVACTITNTALPTGLTLTKQGTATDVDGDRLVDAGDRVAWTVTAENTGRVPLSGLSVDDPTLGAVTCDATALAPGERTTCRSGATTTVTDDDVAAGVVSNTATASALVTGTGTTVRSDAATAEVALDRPEVAVAVTDTTVDGPDAHVVVEVDNPGTVPLTDVAVTVPGTEPVTVPDLEPGDEATVTVDVPLPDAAATVPVSVVATPTTSFGTASPVRAEAEVALPAAAPAPAPAPVPSTPPTAAPAPSPSATPTAVPVPPGGSAVLPGAGDSGSGGPTGSLAFTGASGALLPLGALAVLAVLLGVALVVRRRTARR